MWLKLWGLSTWLLSPVHSQTLCIIVIKSQNKNHKLSFKWSLSNCLSQSLSYWHWLIKWSDTTNLNRKFVFHACVKQLKSYHQNAEVSFKCNGFLFGGHFARDTRVHQETDLVGLDSASDGPSFQGPKMDRSVLTAKNFWSWIWSRETQCLRTHATLNCSFTQETMKKIKRI